MIEIRSEDLAVCLGHLDVSVPDDRRHWVVVAERLPRTEYGSPRRSFDQDDIAQIQILLQAHPVRWLHSETLLWVASDPDRLADVRGFKPSAAYPYPFRWPEPAAGASFPGSRA